jgi:lipoate---protein ligase
MESILRQPGQQPEYRRARTHRDFVRNVPLERVALREAIKDAWGVEGLMAPPACEAVRRETLELARTKYNRPEWNGRS